MQRQITALHKKRCQEARAADNSGILELEDIAQRRCAF